MAVGTDYWTALSNVQRALGLAGVVGLAQPGQSNVSRGIGAANAANTASNVSRSVGGPALPINYAKGLGTAAGAAGLGYGLSQIASDPNLSTGQKVGHSVGLASDVGVSMYVPYGWTYGLAKLLSSQLEKSGSPQVRSTGKAIGAPLLPIGGLMSVLQGDKSPRAAANATVAAMKDVPILGKPIGAMLGFIGIGKDPTTGTMFRRDLGALAKRAGLKDFSTKTPYNMDAEKYNRFSDAARQRAQEIAQAWTAVSPHGRKDMEAYTGQAARMLLGQYGEGVLQLGSQEAAPPVDDKKQRTVR